MLLKNGDKEVLRFSFDDFYLEVLNNEYLPLDLKDWVKTTDYSTPEKIKSSIIFLESFKDFLVSRTLNLSKTNAKAILDSVNLPQSAKTAERLKIVLACNALSMIDNFWVLEDDDYRSFEQVCLRNNRLKDVAYRISIAGIIASATSSELSPDLTVDGMFPKTWYRGKNHLELWKTDVTNGFINTEVEAKVSDLLDKTNVNHVKYTRFEREGRVLVKSACLATDEKSVINGFTVKDWCEHHNTTLLEFVMKNYQQDFAKMCVIDYVLANTDRHLGNVHFFVDNKENKIIGMAPLLDFNQALIADFFGTNVDGLIYDITGKSMLESALEAFPVAKLELETDNFPKECQARYMKLVQAARNI